MPPQTDGPDPRTEQTYSVTPRGLLEVEGPGALNFLQGQTSNDVLALEIGHGCPLVFANPKGGVLADATCFRTEDGALLELDRERAAFLVDHLARYLMFADAQMIDRSDALPATFATGLEVPALTADKQGDAWHLGTQRLGRVPCTLILGDGPRPGRPVDADALEAIRIEEGVPRYGFEFDADTLPQNAGLDDHLSFSKGCFTGQEPIARLHYRGKPSRRLLGLVFEPADAVPPRRSEVLFEGRSVGAVTSSVWSPGLRRPVAIASLKRKAWELDSVQVAGRTAQVRPLPVYPDS